MPTISGPSMYNPAAAKPAQFGTKAQNNGVKFGFEPVTCAACCCSPILLPVAGFAGWGIWKGIKSLAGKIKSMFSKDVSQDAKTSGAAT